MKFQDEGPKLRQRYERKLSGAEEGDRAGASDECASSSSSGASPSPGASNVWDGTGLDVIPGQGQGLRLIGLLEDPCFIPMSESGDDFMQGETRAVTLLNSGRLNHAMAFEAVKLNPMLYSPNLQQQQLL